jgi:DNA-binding response OmpR family regulator
VSEAIRFAEFLARRLRAMGVEVELPTGSTWARGRLELGAAPFETLGSPIVIRQAIFYTLGHGRLKFCQPRVLFDLPALEIAACETRADLERALRREWQKCHRDLAAAHRWLSRVGASVEVARHGTRVLWLPETASRARCEVRSPDEIQLPSSGPLSAARDPAGRRFRPLRGVESASELDCALLAAMRESAVHPARVAPTGSSAARPGARARLLLLSNDEALIAALGAEVARRDAELECHRNPDSALAAFHLQSFDAVLIETRLGRADGLEIALRVREIPGIEDLPLALLDTRDTPTHREAGTELGVQGYAVKPLSPADLARLLDELIEQLSRRRFRRFRARLAVRAAGSDSEDRTELVARGGICLRSARELSVGQQERYSLALPPPHAPVRVQGRVVSRANAPGSATVLAGVRFLGFEAGDEAHWIRVIEDLARRDERKAEE